MARFAVFITAVAAAVAAAPAPAPAPTSSAATSGTLGEIFIKPGPGMPSLESVGLTPAKLYNITMNHAHASDGKLARRAPSYCFPSPRISGTPETGWCNFPTSNLWNPGGMNHIWACAAYLESLGTAMCSVSPAEDLHLCTAYGLPEPEANIWGWNRIYPEYWGASSYCEHVACAVYRVWLSCGDQGNAAIAHGFTVAYGNGDYYVEAAGPY